MQPKFLKKNFWVWSLLSFYHVAQLPNCSANRCNQWDSAPPLWSFRILLGSWIVPLGCFPGDNLSLSILQDYIILYFPKRAGSPSKKFFDTFFTLQMTSEGNWTAVSVSHHRGCCSTGCMKGSLVVGVRISTVTLTALGAGPGTHREWPAGRLFTDFMC